MQHVHTLPSFALRLWSIYAAAVAGIYVTPQIAVARDLDPAVLLTMALMGVLGALITHRITPQADLRVVAARLVLFAGLKELSEGAIKTWRFGDTRYEYEHLTLFVQWLVFAAAVWLVGQVVRWHVRVRAEERAEERAEVRARRATGVPSGE